MCLNSFFLLQTIFNILINILKYKFKKFYLYMILYIMNIEILKDKIETIETDFETKEILEELSLNSRKQKSS